MPGWAYNWPESSRDNADYALISIGEYRLNYKASTGGCVNSGWIYNFRSRIVKYALFGSCRFGNQSVNCFNIELPRLINFPDSTERIVLLILKSSAHCTLRKLNRFLS